MHVNRQLDARERMILEMARRPRGRRLELSPLGENRKLARSYLNQGYPRQVATLYAQWEQWGQDFYHGPARTCEVKAYRLDLTIGARATAAIAELGTYQPIVIGPYYGDPSASIIALVPEDVALPAPGDLGIFRGKKRALHSKGHLHRWAIELEAWERLPALQPYLDVPADPSFTDDVIFDLISGNDPLFKAGLKGPLYSSFPTLGFPGGIGWLATSKGGAFARYLLEIRNRLAAEEMLGLQHRPQRAGTISFGQGINVKAVPAPLATSHRIETYPNGGIQALRMAEDARRRHPGEMSYQSLLNASMSTANATLHEILRQGSRADVITAQLDELAKADVDLERVDQEAIPEAQIHIAQAASRNPFMDDVERLLKKEAEWFQDDLDVRLTPALGKNDRLRESTAAAIARPFAASVIRNSISLARQEGSNEVPGRLTRASRELVREGLDVLLPDVLVRKLRETEEKGERDKKWMRVEAALLEHRRLTTQDLLPLVQPEIKDMYDLVTLLKRWKNENRIYEPRPGAWSVL